MNPVVVDVTEQKRLNEAREAGIPWKKWRPYLSERQWGTVREDYSEGGDAWDYFTHDQARSRAYRWGEDGLAGLSRDGGCCRSSTSRSWSGCSGTCSTRMSFWGRTAFARSRGITWTIRSCFTSVGRSTSGLYLDVPPWQCHAFSMTKLP